MTTVERRIHISAIIEPYDTGMQTPVHRDVEPSTASGIAVTISMAPRTPNAGVILMVSGISGRSELSLSSEFSLSLSLLASSMGT